MRKDFIELIRYVAELKLSSYVKVSEGCGSDKNDVHWSAEDFLNKEVERLQLPNDKVVGLMTADKV